MDASFWLAFVSLIIGLGGLVVAIMGYWSNRGAIGDAWAREWAAQRPVIYPLLLDEWLSSHGDGYQDSSRGRLFPLKNGGRGPALNVTGKLTVTSGTSSLEHQILGGTIAPGDLLNARLVPASGPPAEWAGAHGAIAYGDLVGGAYEQRFSFTKETGGELKLTLDKTTHQTGSVARSPNAPRRKAGLRRSSAAD